MGVAVALQWCDFARIYGAAVPPRDGKWQSFATGALSRWFYVGARGNGASDRAGFGALYGDALRGKGFEEHQE